MDFKEAIRRIYEAEGIRENDKSKEHIFKRALVTHWLQGGVPEHLLSKEEQARWCEALRPSEKLSVTYGSVPFPPPENPKFRFIDLFAGIGGFRLALQDLGGKCVFSSEWNGPAQQTYFKNYGEYPFGDIRDFTGPAISKKDLKQLVPDHDILAAGFPCQPFSHAGVSARISVGKSHGFECETQGTLFFDICRIVDAKQPKVLFLENVQNLKRHDGGKTFKSIQGSIDDLGYTFHPEIIDASSLVPQRRKRCYMICIQKKIAEKLDKQFCFPSFPDVQLPLRSILEDLDEIRSREFTISDKLWRGHINRSARNIARGTGFTAYEVDLNRPSNTIVARYGKDGKECLVPQQGKNPRFLTPRECARLLGFPERFIVPEARTPAYHQFGNSVAVPVIRLIAKSILEKLNIGGDL